MYSAKAPFISVREQIFYCFTPFHPDITSVNSHWAHRVHFPSTRTAIVLPEWQRNNRAVTFLYTQADRPRRALLQNRDFNLQFLARRTMQEIREVLGNEKRHGVVQHCQLFAASRDELDVQSSGIVPALVHRSR